jgi:hypothetical protein
MTKFTSSLGLVDGALQLDWLESLTIIHSGQDRALASLSAPQESERVLKMSDTSGPSFETSSRSDALQSLLASKLRERMGSDGLMGSKVIASHWVTPLGRLVCALRLRDCQKGRACFGWPTATAAGNAGAPSMRKHRAYRKLQDDLSRNGLRLEEWYRAAMGYPTAWDDAGATVTPSSRNSRQSS